MTEAMRSVLLALAVLLIGCTNPFLPSAADVDLSIVPAEAGEGYAVRIENRGPGVASIWGCQDDLNLSIDRLAEGGWEHLADTTGACRFASPPPIEEGEIRVQPLGSLAPGTYRVRVRYGPGRGRAQSEPVTIP
jgi:hypothetical protein